MKKIFKVSPEGEMIRCTYLGKRIISGFGLETRMHYRIELNALRNPLIWVYGI